MPFFILIDFLPSVILEHSETTTRFFLKGWMYYKTGVQLVWIFGKKSFVDVDITRDSQRLYSTLERVSTGLVQVTDGMIWWYYLIFDLLQWRCLQHCSSYSTASWPVKGRLRGGVRRGAGGGGWLGVRGGGKGEQFAFAIKLLLSWLHLRCIFDGHFISILDKQLLHI